jgi:hypothetical protein
MPSTSPRQQKILVAILAGLGVGLIAVSISGSSDAQSNCVRQANRAILLPLVAPIVSSDPTSDRGDLSTTAGVAVKNDRLVRLNSAQVTLKEAQVAVSLSQAQLTQARINLSEFQTKYNSAKILSEQGKISRQQLSTAKSAYDLGQAQQSSALIGVEECTTQLVAAKAEVRRLRREANTAIER